MKMTSIKIGRKTFDFDLCKINDEYIDDFHVSKREPYEFSFILERCKKFAKPVEYRKNAEKMSVFYLQRSARIQMRTSPLKFVGNRGSEWEPKGHKETHKKATYGHLALSSSTNVN